MSEKSLTGIEAQQDVLDAHRYSGLRHLASVVLRSAGCLVASMAPGAIAGSAMGAGIATQESVRIDVMPGIEARAKLSNGATSQLSFGRLNGYSCFSQLPSDILAGYVSPGIYDKPAGNLDLPTAHLNIIGDLDVSVRAKLTRIDCSDKTLQALAGAIQSPDSATAIIEKPIISTLQREAINDITQLAIYGAASSLILAASIEQAANYKRRLGQKESYPYGCRRRTTISTLSLYGAIAATGASTYLASSTSIPSSNKHIGADIIQQMPLLAGASVSNDSLLSVFDSDINQIITQKNQIDSYYKHVKRNVTRTIDAWQQDPANHTLLTEHGLVPALMTSGRHCSDPASELIAPAIMKSLKPLLTFDTGNVDVAPNLPLHNFCVSLLKSELSADEQAANQKVYMYAVAGKHDNMQLTLGAEANIQINGPDGKPYHPVITFGITDSRNYSNYGVSVVGGSSAVESPDGQYDRIRLASASAALKLAATPKQQADAYREAGQSALKGCLDANSLNVTPIALFNSREQGYPLLQNCTLSALLAGEGPTGFFDYSQNANTNTNIIVEGSSAGNGIGCYDFRPYQRIVGDAQYIYMLIDPVTNSISYYSNLLISSNGTVTMSPLSPLPNQAYNQTIVDNFNNQTSVIYSSSSNKLRNPASC